MLNLEYFKRSIKLKLIKYRMHVKWSTHWKYNNVNLVYMLNLV